MTKRLIRYATIVEAIEQQEIVKQSSSCSIVLKSGKVYTGRVLRIDTKNVVFENMRLKEQQVEVEELCELIIDVKSK